MQNIKTNGIGVTQFNGMRPRNMFTIGGVNWSLRRDATDSSTFFPHHKVNWLNAGCEPIGDGSVHYCWIMGVIAPTPGTIERPVNVMYIGFHPQKIIISPNSITQSDLDRMHVYVSDSAGFVSEFVGKFLGIESDQPATERESISPWPVTARKEADEPKEQPRQKVIKDE